MESKKPCCTARHRLCPHLKPSHISPARQPNDGEMAEWLMALVFKVQREPKKLDKSKVSPMFDIGFLLFWMSFDGKMSEKRAIRFIEKSDGT